MMHKRAKKCQVALRGTIKNKGIKIIAVPIPRQKIYCLGVKGVNSRKMYIKATPNEDRSAQKTQDVRKKINHETVKW